jgi:hypothetical protein
MHAYHLWLAGGRREGGAEEDWRRARAELEAGFERELSPLRDPS